jgi:hypothetical protein
MGERKNTAISCFDNDSPRIFANEIHEWIHDRLRLHETDAYALQIVELKRQVFIKFRSADTAAVFRQRTPDIVPYTHTNGERSQVYISNVGIGTRQVGVGTYP